MIVYLAVSILIGLLFYYFFYIISAGALQPKQVEYMSGSALSTLKLVVAWACFLYLSHIFQRWWVSAILAVPGGNCLAYILFTLSRIR
jgi:hypothetical protein